MFPLVATATLTVAAVIGPSVNSKLESLEKRMPFVAALTSPVVLLALVPPSMVFVAAFFRPMVDQQALLAFTPYLPIVLAAGAREWGRRKVVAVLH